MTEKNNKTTQPVILRSQFDNYFHTMSELKRKEMKVLVGIAEFGFRFYFSQKIPYSLIEERITKDDNDRFYEEIRQNVSEVTHLRRDYFTLLNEAGEKPNLNNISKHRYLFLLFKYEVISISEYSLLTYEYFANIKPPIESDSDKLLRTTDLLKFTCQKIDIQLSSMEALKKNESKYGQLSRNMGSFIKLFPTFVKSFNEASTFIKEQLKMYRSKKPERVDHNTSEIFVSLTKTENNKHYSDLCDTGSEKMNQLFEEYKILERELEYNKHYETIQDVFPTPLENHKKYLPPQSPNFEKKKNKKKTKDVRIIYDLVERNRRILKNNFQLIEKFQRKTRKILTFKKKFNVLNADVFSKLIFLSKLLKSFPSSGINDEKKKMCNVMMYDTLKNMLKEEILSHIKKIQNLQEKIPSQTQDFFSNLRSKARCCSISGSTETEEEEILKYLLRSPPSYFCEFFPSLFSLDRSSNNAVVIFREDMIDSLKEFDVVDFEEEEEAVGGFLEVPTTTTTMTSSTGSFKYSPLPQSLSPLEGVDGPSFQELEMLKDRIVVLKEIEEKARVKNEKILSDLKKENEKILSDLKNEHQVNLRKKDEEMESMKKEILDEIEVKKNKIKSLEDQFEKNIRTVRTQASLELARTKEEHEEKLKSKKKEYEILVKNMKDEMLRSFDREKDELMSSEKLLKKKIEEKDSMLRGCIVLSRKREEEVETMVQTIQEKHQEEVSSLLLEKVEGERRVSQLKKDLKASRSEKDRLIRENIKINNEKGNLTNTFQSRNNELEKRSKQLLEDLRVEKLIQKKMKIQFDTEKKRILEERAQNGKKIIQSERKRSNQQLKLKEVEMNKMMKTAIQSERKRSSEQLKLKEVEVNKMKTTVQSVKKRSSQQLKLQEVEMNKMKNQLLKMKMIKSRNETLRKKLRESEENVDVITKEMEEQTREVNRKIAECEQHKTRVSELQKQIEVHKRRYLEKKKGFRTSLHEIIEKKKIERVKMISKYESEMNKLRNRVRIDNQRFVSVKENYRVNDRVIFFRSKRKKSDFIKMSGGRKGSGRFHTGLSFDKFDRWKMMILSDRDDEREREEVYLSSDCARHIFERMDKDAVCVSAMIVSVKKCSYEDNSLERNPLSLMRTGKVSGYVVCMVTDILIEKGFQF